MMRRIWLALAACLAVFVSSGGPAAAAEQAPAGDGPPGFWWGTDSFNVTVPGSAPYSMPFLGGAYGGYIGMTGNWAYWLGCSGQEHFIAYSARNAAQAHTNFVTYHRGVGTGAYWFMGGPGVDPRYNGTVAEAISWGQRQAARALIDIANGGGIDYPVVWMDIELPGIKPAPDNGWNSVYTTPCSGVKKQGFVPASLDRGVFDGFWGYIKAHSHYQPGVYSSAGVWQSIFAGTSYGNIPHTDEWTYEPETTSYISKAPYGFCLNHGSGPCAQFFGGVTRNSSNALMWQWSGGGGALNGIGGFNGDLDQIDGARHP
jgi:hypothetical protein